MKNQITRSILLAASSSLLAAFSTSAANTFFSPGDLMLTFQKIGSDTIYADLGNAASLYRGAGAGAADGTNSINFLNLSSTLSATYGSGWASDPNIYVGLGGVFSANQGTTLDANGDPGRTLYVSSSRNDVGNLGESNSAAMNIATGSSGTSAAGGILSQNNIFGDSNGLNGYNSSVIVSPVGVSGIDDQNPLTVFQGNTSQGTAYGVFAGGVQQVGSATAFGTFGAAGQVEFALDLYRILTRGPGGTQTSSNVTGQVTGPIRTGTYEGTITVGSNGQVSFVSGISAVPEPSGALALGLIGTVAGLGYRRRRSA